MEDIGKLFNHREQQSASVWTCLPCFDEVGSVTGRHLAGEDLRQLSKGSLSRPPVWPSSWFWRRPLKQKLKFHTSAESAICPSLRGTTKSRVNNLPEVVVSAPWLGFKPATSRRLKCYTFSPPFRHVTIAACGTNPSHRRLTSQCHSHAVQ